MRLPYLQLAEKFIAVQSKVVARMLGIKRKEAIGMGALLFESVVELTSSDEEPPSGIILGSDAADIVEAGMEWEGERGKAFGAFVRADVIEQLEGGARVKGCDRYHDAWAKQQRRRSAAKAGAAARWRPASSVSAMPATSERHADPPQSHANRIETAHASDASRSAQTETETEKEDLQPPPVTLAADPLPADATVLVPAPVPTLSVGRRPAPPGELAKDFLAFEAARAKRFRGPAMPYPPPGFETRWPAFLAAHGGDREWGMQTYARFWEDDWAQRLKPPGALNAFLAPDQWPKFFVAKREPDPLCHDCGQPSGELVVADSEGQVHVCYPCLNARKAAEPGAPERRSAWR